MDVKEDNYRKRMGLGQDGNALMHLIIINAVLFVILKFVFVIYLLAGLRPEAYYNNVFSWFALPAGIERFLSRPWTLLTDMFADYRVFRFISNMFWLWCFGYILQDLTGNRKLIPIYIYGGLAGGIAFVTAHYLIPGLQAQVSSSALSGANPAIVAVAVATTTVAPDYRIFPMINGGIPLWVLTLIYILINFSSISYGDSSAYMANLAGAGMGFLFIYQMRRGRDWSAWMNRFFDWCNNLFDPDKKKNDKSGKDEFFYNVSGTQPYKKIPHITQKRIDDILDKINQQGYRFLTNEEKDILKRAAEEEDL
ncbi:MAG: rhomboid family intramembrane serine protease [Bacteroidetes bacterium]|nr:MAG: rhomboid family intramembrane serine protease [Bacteroidota bacterium]